VHPPHPAIFVACRAVHVGRIPFVPGEPPTPVPVSVTSVWEVMATKEGGRLNQRNEMEDGPHAPDLLCHGGRAYLDELAALPSKTPASDAVAVKRAAMLRRQEIERAAF